MQGSAQIRATNKVISNVYMNKIVSIKNSMNSKREMFTYDTSKSQIIINPNWFIGVSVGHGEGRLRHLKQDLLYIFK
jgi:hypothetical protein